MDVCVRARIMYVCVCVCVHHVCVCVCQYVCTSLYVCDTTPSLVYTHAHIHM
jgi:hypothetical protein